VVGVNEGIGVVGLCEGELGGIDGDELGVSDGMEIEGTTEGRFVG